MYNNNTIMSNEIIENLEIKKNGIYIDGTFGMGGHSKLILKKLGNYGKLLVFDKDLYSIKLAKSIKDKRLLIFHNSFSKMKDYLLKLNLLNKINGIILDLGISMYQINNNNGFSFKKKSILDMRINNKIGISAIDLLNKSSEKTLNYIFKYLGNEKNYKIISKEIINYRKNKNIIYTTELSNIIQNVYKKKYFYSKKNPSTKCFQAIRIFINDELNDLNILLKDIPFILSNNGKLLIISFNSLEGRIIKNSFRNSSEENLLFSRVPFNENQIQKIKLDKKKFNIKIIKKIKISKNEIKKNLNYRSAILRVFKKI